MDISVFCVISDGALFHACGGIKITVTLFLKDWFIWALHIE